MANEPGHRSNGSTIWPWALAVGALGGFVIGREMGPRAGGGRAERPDKVAEAAGVAKKAGAGAAAGQPPPPPGPKRVDIPAHSPRKGPKNAKVTIVEFSDFQCPFCGRVVPTVNEVMQKYGKDVRLAFVNQPLPFHENA